MIKKEIIVKSILIISAVLIPGLALAQVSLLFDNGGNAYIPAGLSMNLTGTITNTSSTTPVYLTDLSDINLTLNDLVQEEGPEVDQSASWAFLPGMLSPGQQYHGPLVKVTTSTTTPPGIYEASYDLIGGSDASSNSLVTSQLIAVQVIATATPGTSSVLSTASTTPTNFSSFVGLQFPGGNSSSTTVGGLQMNGGTFSIPGFMPGPRLIKPADDSTVYWVSSGNLKIGMLSAAVFLSYGNKWEDIQTVDEGEFNNYATAKYIWLNGTGAIYKITNGVRHYIPSSVWNPAGIDSSQIINVNSTDFNSYSKGDNISDAAGLGN